jgi:hypothetical protein
VSPEAGCYLNLAVTGTSPSLETGLLGGSAVVNPWGRAVDLVPGELGYGPRFRVLGAVGINFWMRGATVNRTWGLEADGFMPGVALFGVRLRAEQFPYVPQILVLDSTTGDVPLPDEHRGATYFSVGVSALAPLVRHVEVMAFR